MEGGEDSWEEKKELLVIVAVEFIYNHYIIINKYRKKNHYN